MPDQVTNYQCPACGGPLRYDGKTDKLVCDYCGSTYAVKEIEDHYSGEDSKAADAMAQSAAAEAKEAEGKEDWEHVSDEWDGDGMALYNCPSCGAQLIIPDTTGATSCPYCGNPSIIPGKFEGILKPDYIIPFRKQREDAVKALKEHYKHKFLLPKVFSDENHIEEVKGVYVPFWLYDGEVSAHNTYEGTRTSVMETRDERITTTNYYEIGISGRVTFSRVPADGSSQMPDAIMDSIEPYDYSELTKFSNAYLPGFLADKYDVSLQDCESRAKEREMNTTTKVMANEIREYDSVRPMGVHQTLQGGRVAYALMPVWMLSTKWRDKNYIFAMNGQTGKMVGDLPCDEKKAWITTACAFAISSLCGLLFLVAII